MTRFSHGADLPVVQISSSINYLRKVSGLFGGTIGLVPEVGRFGFLFEELQNNDNNLLPVAPDTARKLIALGEAMVDPDPFNPASDSTIPSAYTYFGQFIDHDLTRLSMTSRVVLDENVMPVLPDVIPTLINSRSPGLDLDSVYGPAIEHDATYNVPRNGDRLVIEFAIPDRPPDTDLPRDPTPGKPHPAFIGNRKNDENLIISQMHLAFLRAHNVLIDGGASFADARKLLRRHYQWIIVNDYLNRIADPDIVQKVVEGEIDIFDPIDDDFRMPLEFTVAAFRFGHSMIRDGYNYNDHFDRAFLFQLLLPGALVKYNHILATWIIDWRRFFDGRNVARQIDTFLAEGLQLLDDGQGHSLKFGLAVLDLLRGYLLRLPTGQAVANALSLAAMSADEIHAAIGAHQAHVLSSLGFSNRTPLWFYILAEAAATKTGHLGPVGSRIVAAVIVGLVRTSKDSYLRHKNWTPTLGHGAHFNLTDLFRFAGVLPDSE